MTNPVQEVQRLGQSIWYDNIRRGLIQSGALRRLIDLGNNERGGGPERMLGGGTVKQLYELMKATA